MPPHQSTRIDLVDLKMQILRKLGNERSRKYFHYLNRFLLQKLSKKEFDKSCAFLLGRDGIVLHNQLIRSVMKNACQAKSPPSVHEIVTAKQANKGAAVVHGRENGRLQGNLLKNHVHNRPIWSNGFLPVSPRKIRSGIRERRLRDRPSPLGPNGKTDSVPFQSKSSDDCGSKIIQKNGKLLPCFLQRSTGHLDTVAEQPHVEKDNFAHCIAEDETQHLLGKAAEDDKLLEQTQATELSFSRSTLNAPVGLPAHSSTFHGARGSFFSCYDSGYLPDTHTLQKQMEHIADMEGLKSVSFEAATLVNNALDVYLKRLIKPCLEITLARSSHQLGKQPEPAHKERPEGKVLNGLWPSNHPHSHNHGGTHQVIQEQLQQHSVSLLDFKTAMEVNPRLLGSDWPNLLERICTQFFTG